MAAEEFEVFAELTAAVEVDKGFTVEGRVLGAVDAADFFGIGVLRISALSATDLPFAATIGVGTFCVTVLGLFTLAVTLPFGAAAAVFIAGKVVFGAAVGVFGAAVGVLGAALTAFGTGVIAF